MQEAKFSIDTLGDKIFDGYTQGEEWNGWACPYFTFEQAQKVAEAFNEGERFEGDKVKARYNVEQDAFCFFFESSGESDDFPSLEVDGLKLYPVGAGCWIWEEVEAYIISG
jgi:hypothetical protein